MIFRTGERSIPNTGRDLNTGVMHAARVVVSTRQQKIGNSILALQIRYKFVGKGQFCARHSLELIEQIFNRPDSLPIFRQLNVTWGVFIKQQSSQVMPAGEATLESQFFYDVV